MRIKRVLVPATLAGFAASLSIGCSPSTDVPLAPAPAVQETPPKEVPKDPKARRKGGGSGLMKRNPGGNT